jgi:hypothetical protein
MSNACFVPSVSDEEKKFFFQNKHQLDQQLCSSPWWQPVVKMLSHGERKKLFFHQHSTFDVVF